MRTLITKRGTETDKIVKSDDKGGDGKFGCCFVAQGLVPLKISAVDERENFISKITNRITAMTATFLLGSWRR